MSEAPKGNTGQLSAVHSVVGGYEILSKIGQGGMGAVFKARQVSVDRVVALKVLPPRLAKNPRYVVRFLREARAAAKLSHLNIVQAIDAGQAGPYYYFAMEFVDGRSAEQVIRKEGRLSERRALEVVRDMARALDCAHDAGLIHRDVKPDNILLTADGTAKLADLGLARETAQGDSNVTQAGEALGTPDYISPEQIRGETDLDGRTDIYSLGGTLYRLLTGKTPFAGGTTSEVMTKHLTQPPPDPRTVCPEVSAGAAAIVRKAMAKDRKHRYANVKQLLQDTDAALFRLASPVASEPVGAGPAKPPKPKVRGARQRRGVWIGAACAAAILLVAVVALIAWPKHAPQSGPATLGTTGQPAVPNPAIPRPVPITQPAVVKNPTTAPVAVKPTDADALDAVERWVAQNPGRRAEGIKRYEAAIAGMTDAAVRTRAEAAVRALRAAEAAAQVTPEKLLAALLGQIEAAAAKGDLAGAAQLGQAAVQDVQLAPLAEKVRLVVAVSNLLPEIGLKKKAWPARALQACVGQPVTLGTTQAIKAGKVKRVTGDTVVLDWTFVINDKVHEREESVAVADLTAETLVQLKLRWTPGTPDEAIGEALLGLAVRDEARAEAALALAAGHGLRAYFDGRLAEVKKERRDGEARVFWQEAIAPSLDLKEMNDKAASAVLTVLDYFKGEHGATDFAKSVDEQARTLRAKALAVLGGPDVMRIQKLFKGKVTAFDPKTLTVRLAYDFENAEQAEDWEPSRGGRKPDDAIRIKDGSLRLNNTRMQALVKARFTDVTIGADFTVGGGSYGATLVVCSDGVGNHYELVGLWKGDDFPIWRCHLCSYVNKHFASESFGKKWPLKDSPFAATRRGTFSLQFAGGQLKGTVGKVLLEARDDSLKSGQAGVWAFDTFDASFDNVQVSGRLERDWYDAAVRKAGLKE